MSGGRCPSGSVRIPYPTTWVALPTWQGLMEGLRENLGLIPEYGLEVALPIVPGEDPAHPL